jgi:hypothetical protein
MQGALPNGDTVGRRWTYTNQGDTLHGTILGHGPQYTVGDNDSFRFAGFSSIPTGGSGYIQLNPSSRTAVFTDNVTVGMFWTFLVPPTASAGVTFLMGFNCNGQAIYSINDGAFLFKRPTDTNWMFETVSGGSPSIAVDTGIPAASGDEHTAAIVLVGANQSDDSVARALIFIDGNLVGNITTNLPYSSGGALPLSPILGTSSTATASDIELLVGPVRFRSSMFT